MLPENVKSVTEKKGYTIFLSVNSNSFQHILDKGHSLRGPRAAEILLKKETIISFNLNISVVK